MEEEIAVSEHERMVELKKRLLTLEWDKAHNQLNSGMAARFEELKTEYETLQKKLASKD